MLLFLASNKLSGQTDLDHNVPNNVEDINPNQDIDNIPRDQVDNLNGLEDLDIYNPPHQDKKPNTNPATDDRSLLDAEADLLDERSNTDNTATTPDITDKEVKPAIKQDDNISHDDESEKNDARNSKNNAKKYNKETQEAPYDPYDYYIDSEIAPDTIKSHKTDSKSLFEDLAEIESNYVISGPNLGINCYFGNEIRSYVNPLLDCKAKIKNYLTAYFNNYSFEQLNVIDTRFNKNIDQNENFLRIYRSSWKIIAISIIIVLIAVVKLIFPNQLSYIYTAIKKSYLITNKRFCLLQNNIIIYTIISLIVSLLYGFIINNSLINTDNVGYMRNYLQLWLFFSAIILLFLIFRLICQKLSSIFFESATIYELCICISVNLYLLSIIVLLPIVCIQILSVNILNIFTTKLTIIVAIVCVLALYVFIAIYTMLKTKTTIIDLIVYLCIFEAMPIMLIYKIIELYTITV